ncbi:N-acetylmuramoyl-L-alanine amidase [Facklamia miroungae]|uniref:N-acetylmuramoyl-L-alanine amidase n=1 Tax=Facklamia miroungae TaxID=120956 RepID=A0A1G7QZG5_9LACT|nr:N-acetylmuramoyl-L-alanine amidase [Facklamia miroungae]NKZ29122.1 hypothetical protein [Facklamia miroungae]SDG03916.1 N-acetylmuramoyl-L-alanine amidase [Facklamia miroungae]
MLLREPTIKKILQHKQIVAFFFTFTICMVSFWCIYSLSNLQVLQIERQGVSLHPFPTTNSDILTELKPHSSFEVIQEEGGWIKGRYQGKFEGWLPTWLLNNKHLKSDQNLAGVFKQSTAIFQEPDSKTPVVSQIAQDSLIPISYVEKDWALVNYQGRPAFVELNKLELIDRQEAEVIMAEKEANKSALNEKQKAKERLKNIVVMRDKEGYLLEEADNLSNIIYQTDFLQEFTKLDYIEYSPQESYYLVEDSQGIKGYINSFSLSEPIYSLDHRYLPINHKLAQATIMLDPGHGGEDPGTISTDQQHFEKSFTYKIAHVLKNTLEAFGATVIMTNEQDQFLDLSERAQISNHKQPDLFLSLHFDASYDTDLKGIRTYFYHLEDEEFAKTLHNGFNTANRPDLGVEYGNFQVLRENTVPAVLLELGYITNAEDLELMLTDEYYQVLADSITDGLVKYFNQIENQHTINNPNR